MNHATVISISMYTLDLCTLTSLLLYSRKRIIENNTIGLIQHCVSSRLFQFIVRFCPMYQMSCGVNRSSLFKRLLLQTCFLQNHSFSFEDQHYFTLHYFCYLFMDVLTLKLLRLQLENMCDPLKYGFCKKSFRKDETLTS